MMLKFILKLEYKKKIFRKSLVLKKQKIPKSKKYENIIIETNNELNRFG